MGVPDGQRRDDEHRAALGDLRKALERNEQAVLSHLNAVREVADIIRGAIRRSETDARSVAAAVRRSKTRATGAAWKFPPEISSKAKEIL